MTGRPKHQAVVVGSYPLRNNSGQRLLVECGERRYDVLLVQKPDGSYLPVISPAQGLPTRDAASAAALTGIERLVNGGVNASD